MAYRVGISGLRRGVALARMFEAMPDCQVVAACDLTDPPIGIEAALAMALPGICAHESAMNGGRPVPIPDWRG